MKEDWTEDTGKTAKAGETEHSRPTVYHTLSHVYKSVKTVPMIKYCTEKKQRNLDFMSGLRKMISLLAME